MNAIFQFILSLLWIFGTTGFSFGAKDASGSSLINHLGFSQNGGERLAETRVYDRLNRLRSVAHLSDAALNAVAKSFTYSYNSANQRTRVDREDGTHWDYGYDALGHLTGAVKKQGDSTALAGQRFAYQYDALGNRLSASFGGDAGGTGGLQTASYTASATGDRNQYAAITAPGVVLTTGKANLATAITVNGESAQVRQGEFFSHQTPVSNSTGPVEIDITVTATTGGQSDSVTRRELVDAASRDLTHDADGNVLFDGYRDYTWDAENRLLSVQTRAGLVPAGGVEYRVAYAYDYAGRRIHRLAERKVGNAWYLLNQRSYLYDGWNVVAECSDTAAGARQLEQSYLWGLDISGTPQGAGGVGGLLAIEKHLGAQAGIHFASHDGNGNVVALTNAADGTLSASYEYDPFGNLLEMSGAFAAQNPYRFSTKRQDELTGFYDYGFRTYDPGTGRWLSRDPIQEDGGLNLYGFVGNDGVNGVDVLGQYDLWYGITHADYTASGLINVGNAIKDLVVPIAQGLGAWVTDPGEQARLFKLGIEELGSRWSDIFASSGDKCFWASIIDGYWEDLKEIPGAWEAIANDPELLSQFLADTSVQLLAEALAMKAGKALQSEASAGFRWIEGSFDFAPGYSNGLANRAMRRQFESEMNALGVTTKFIESGDSFFSPSKMTVHLNKLTATPGTLLDEFTHAFNAVHGKGKYLPDKLAQRHQQLAQDVKKYGDTNSLGRELNTLYHQLELKNFLNSGAEIPGFIRAIPQSDLEKFLNIHAGGMTVGY